MKLLIYVKIIELIHILSLSLIFSQKVIKDIKKADMIRILTATSVSKVVFALKLSGVFLEQLKLP